MGIFGWSLPPGCGTLPGEEAEQPIQLRDDCTLKGYGRSQHGLNGKDADLDYGGQNIVREAWWHSDGTIEISGRRYACIVPNDNATDEQMDSATELICGEDCSGEWDGDYWVMGENYSLRGRIDWDDAKSDENNEAEAAGYAWTLIHEDSKGFELRMRALSKAVEEATANDNTTDED